VITARRLVPVLLALCAGLSATLMARAEPEADRLALRAFFAQRFSGLPFEDYVLGSFMLNPDGRRHYEDIMAFPPFEVDIDRGRVLWETPFQSGGTYAQCLPSGGRNIAGHYPRFDESEDTLVTFEMLLNRCRIAGGEQPYRHDDMQTMGVLSAYARGLSDGMTMNIRVDSPAARRRYESGKALFHRRIGQMNFSCANCHVDNAGKIMRMEIISPALGEATHFPVFPGGDALYTLHARYTRCMEQVRAQPFPMGSEEFKDLEYFHAYMSNGLPLRASVYRR
jgi:sulfur-oxidizing protein SoxA